MGISKKGLRNIVVNDREFYWKFNGKIYITSDRNGLLIVDFGWYDKWLYVNDKENEPADFEPKSITPQFVSASISFALSQGWDNNKMEVIFREGQYKKKAF